jgi:hypothetical protein
MACVTPLALALALAATPPETTTTTMHRHAAILSAVGITAMVGGATVLGLGVHAQHAGTEVGGVALASLGLTVLVLAIVTWVWPGPGLPWHASL